MASTPVAAAPAPAVKALSCPSCGGTITLRAAGYTVTVACQYCGSILDVANPDVRLVKEYHEAATELEIPLGTRGTLRGVEWEAIGYLRRSEDGAYPWVEYLLFNPYHGYRFLVTNGRGWSLVEQLMRTPDWGPGGLILDGEAYQPFFTNGTAQVDYVIGEFYWRVQVGERVATDDYVRPGFMLSREANAQEVSWSLSTLLSPDEVEQAFDVRAPRKPWPPLPHQPSPYARTLRTGVKFTLGAAAFLLLLTFIFSGGGTLYRGSLPLALDGQAKSATLGPIEVTRPWQLVSIRAEAPTLEDGWVDLDYALVDRATQTSYEAYGVAERYSGRDSDGAWTEGSRRATVKLASVPRGTYDLVVDYTGNRWQGGSSTYTPTYSSPDLNMMDGSWSGAAGGKPGDNLEGVGDGGGKDGAPGGTLEGSGAAAERAWDGPTMRIEVGRAQIFPSNLILALLLLFVPVLFLFWRHMKFERARQAESDVGPTGLAAMLESDDDDDE